MRKNAEDRDQVGGKQRPYAIGSARVSGLAHAAVISEQGLGSALGESFEIGSAGLELRKGLSHRSLADMRRRIGGGRYCQES